MQKKVFRLNTYENCRKVLKYFHAFELYRVNVLTIGRLRLRIYVPIEESECKKILSSVSRFKMPFIFA